VNDTRQYPARPIVGVGAVVLDARGQVVLIRRRFEPLAGQWSLPGGMLEIGEALEEGAAREVREETGLEVSVGPMIETFDRITRDEAGRVKYHFVLVDFLCRAVSGQLRAGSDVDAVALVSPDGLSDYRLTTKATAVITRALEMARDS
jgi:ADP-ribose pyrophosphatase YjhB (NUDIX family)